MDAARVNVSFDTHILTVRPISKRLRGGNTAISASKESYHFSAGTRAGKGQCRQWLLFSMASSL